MILVLHDDAQREYAYGPAQGLPDTKVPYDEANKEGWTVISMKNHWNRTFAFEASRARCRPTAKCPVMPFASCASSTPTRRPRGIPDIGRLERPQSAATLVSRSDHRGDPSKTLSLLFRGNLTLAQFRAGARPAAGPNRYRLD
jgi:hypothetical protein